MEEEVPVLIVGGGPVGLSMSLLLSRHGMRSLLIERHAGTSIHPRARGLNVRTMELFRVWGLEASVRAAGAALETARDVVWATALVAEETRRAPYGGDPERLQADSPTMGVGCAQDELEPVLLAAARARTLGEVRFNYELDAFEQDPDGVTATVHERTSGEETTIRAAYLIAADGADSPIRASLGARMIGSGVLAHRMSIYFQADLTDVVADRPALLYFISNAEARGIFAGVNMRDRWVFVTEFDLEQEPAERYTEERCIELVRKASGLDNLAVKIISALPWKVSAQAAERFRHGRAFLAGDAAHLIPPLGGQALNVGIQDAHNLAWKLAAVLGGWAGPGLLETYDSERRAVAAWVTEEVSLNAKASGSRLEQFSNRGMVLGTSYESSAVVGDGSMPAQVLNPVTDYIPTARPGGRAPHIWLQRGGQRISTIDLFDTEFALLAGPTANPWCRAAEDVRRRRRLPLSAHTIGPDGDLVDEDGNWPELYGIKPDGAVLVRPDGHVAWRANHGVSDPSVELDEVLRKVLARIA
ncbi:MAG: FAD-dependent monooxygenase [Candidatus Dormibacteraceae bacterium]